MDISKIVDQARLKGFSVVLCQSGPESPYIQFSRYAPLTGSERIDIDEAEFLLLELCLDQAFTRKDSVLLDTSLGYGDSRFQRQGHEIGGHLNFEGRQIAASKIVDNNAKVLWTLHLEFGTIAAFDQWTLEGRSSLIKQWHAIVKTSGPKEVNARKEFQEMLAGTFDLSTINVTEIALAKGMIVNVT